MTCDGNEEPIRITRINRYLRDLLPLSQAQVDPRCAAVGGLVNSIADRQIRTMQPLTAAHVNDIGIRRRHFDRADGAGRLLVKDGLPGPAKVIGLPNAAIHRSHVEDIRLARHARDRTRAATTKRADISPLHVGENAGVDLLGLGRKNGAEGENQNKERNRSGECSHRPVNLNVVIWSRDSARRKCNLLGHIFAQIEELELRLTVNRLRRTLLVPAAIVFLHCCAVAQPVSPELFSGLQWRMIGPFRGGRVVAVTGVPGDGTTFYFGSVGGGIWKTIDAGVTWTPIFDGQPIASIGALEVAPSNPKILYAGTGESDIRSDLSSGDGVYKSTDGGATWKNIGLRDSKQISRIVVDPNNPDVVYVAVLGHAYGPNDERGVYKSNDGGQTWIRTLFKSPEVGASDLAIAAGSPNILFAGMWNAHRPPWSTYAPLAGPGSGLYRSTDSGATWTQLTGHGLPDGDWGRVGVAVAPDGKRVYALIDAAKKSGLYRSDDGGDNWTLANSDPRLTSRAWYFSHPTVDPNNPDVVYIPNVALYRSEDGGKTISILRGAPGGDDYHQLWVDPKNSSRMVLGTDQGTTISLNYGKTWSSWYNQPTAQFYHVITDNEFPYHVYGAQQDTGAAAVASRTDHTTITARDWFLVGGGESGWLAPDPGDPNIIFATGVYGSVLRWDRRTSLGQDITPWPMPNWNTEINERKYRGPWTPMLVFSPIEKNTLYLGTQYVMKTIDGGLHWQRISPDLTGAAANATGEKPSGPVAAQNAKERGFGVVFSIAPSPLNASQIWAGSDTGLIHLTRDGGKTWQNVTPARCCRLEPSFDDRGVALRSRSGLCGSGSSSS